MACLARSLLLFAVDRQVGATRHTLRNHAVHHPHRIQQNQHLIVHGFDGNMSVFAAWPAAGTKILPEPVPDPRRKKPTFQVNGPHGASFEGINGPHEVEISDGTSIGLCRGPVSSPSLAFLFLFPSSIHWHPTAQAIQTGHNCCFHMWKD